MQSPQRTHMKLNTDYVRLLQKHDEFNNILDKDEKYPNLWGYPSRLLQFHVVRWGGLEPPRLSAHGPQPCLSANSSTSACAPIL
jgi:hypothetical protein